MFIISIICYIISLLQFLEKMPLLNNTYSNEKENVDKKPYYIQAGIVFLLVGIIFTINGIGFLLKLNWLFYTVIIIAVITIIYTIASTVHRMNKGKNN